MKYRAQWTAILILLNDMIFNEKSWITMEQECYTPMQECYTPMQKCYILMQECYTPMQECYTPMQECYIPMQECYIPMQECYTPMQECYTPMPECYIPMPECYIPMQECYTPMQECLSVSLSNDLGDPVFDSVGLGVSRAGLMPFYWPSCSLPSCLLLFSLSLLSFYGLVLWGWGFRTDGVLIANSQPCVANRFNNNNNNNNVTVNGIQRYYWKMLGLQWPGASQWRIYYHRMWGQLSTTCSNYWSSPMGNS